MKGTTPQERGFELQRVLNSLYDDEDPTCNMVDMLTDLRHMCDVLEEDFAECDRMAYAHYVEEKQSGVLEFHLEP